MSNDSTFCSAYTCRNWRGPGIARSCILGVLVCLNRLLYAGKRAPLALAKPVAVGI